MRHLVEHSQDLKALVKAIGWLHSPFVSERNAVVHSRIDGVDRSHEAGSMIANCRFRFPFSDMGADVK
jgi:hypothetical protein